jgi:sulfotransferase family protein
MKFTHIHHTSEALLNDFYKNYTPVFVLNTGRSGSALLQRIFTNFNSVKAYHEAPPNLFLQSNYAFHNQHKKEVLQKIFEAARIELILEAKVENLIYLETNQCLVFYINQIRKTFPNAKFIHLTRHPGGFVRSAIRKGWHKNDSVWELGRIKMDDTDAWSDLSQIEKLGWVWTETHAFIEQFKNIFPENCFTLRFEDLIQSYDHFKEMVHFIGIDNKFSQKNYNEFFSVKENERVITYHEPPNMFKLESFPQYSEWLETDKNALKKWASELSRKYNYHLD